MQLTEWRGVLAFSVGCSQHTLASNITLLKATEVDEIYRGNDFMYRSAGGMSRDCLSGGGGQPYFAGADMNAPVLASTSSTSSTTSGLPPPPPLRYRGVLSRCCSVPAFLFVFVFVVFWWILVCLLLAPFLWFESVCVVNYL